MSAFTPDLTINSHSAANLRTHSQPTLSSSELTSSSDIKPILKSDSAQKLNTHTSSQPKQFEHIHQLLQHMVAHNASDLHLSSGMPAMMRVHGDILKLDMPALSAEQVAHFIDTTMNDRQRQDFATLQEVDYAINLPDGERFRVNAFVQQRGSAAVFRHLATTLLNLTELSSDHSATLINIAERHQGLVLVTGATGSGKSTTLAALIDYINQTRQAHILTLEDPIEFVHQPQLSLINQRQISQHTPSFDSALRAALREDPDVILIGELRDLTSIRLALTAAETGHLVFATLHTRSAVKTIDRIIDVFPAEEKPMIRAMLSESLQAVVSQSLVKCDAGGRIAALEILLSTPATRNLIRQNKLTQLYSTIQTGGNLGMITLDDSLKKLYQQNLISQTTLQQYAKHSDSAI